MKQLRSLLRRFLRHPARNLAGLALLLLVLWLLTFRLTGLLLATDRLLLTALFFLTLALCGCALLRNIGFKAKWKAFRRRMHTFWDWLAGRGSSGRRGRRMARARLFRDERSRITAKPAGGNRPRPFHRGRGEGNAGRVRYVYARYLRRIIRRGFAFRPSDTPREIEAKTARSGRFSSPEGLVPLYNRARYQARGGRIGPEELHEVIGRK